MFSPEISTTSEVHYQGMLEFNKTIRSTHNAIYVLTADNVVESSDGQKVCRFAPDGGKKKNQTKREINVRTTTVNKKQRH